MKIKVLLMKRLTLAGSNESPSQRFAQILHLLMLKSDSPLPKQFALFALMKTL